MDIRNWPIDKIMQLPDHCFGRRWPIGLLGSPYLDNPVFDISEASLPDTTVIWKLSMWTSSLTAKPLFVEIRLGDHLPTTDAEFWAMEPVFSGVRDANNLPSSFEFNRNMLIFTGDMKMAVKAQGRRLVVRFVADDPLAINIFVNIVVSSVPTEVPDWLCSR